MKQLIESLNKARLEKNWYAALFIALSLPDICGNIEYPNEGVGSRYKKWFNDNLIKYYKHNIGVNEENFVF